MDGTVVDIVIIGDVFGRCGTVGVFFSLAEYNVSDKIIQQHPVKVRKRYITYFYLD